MSFAAPTADIAATSLIHATEERTRYPGLDRIAERFATELGAFLEAGDLGPAATNCAGNSTMGFGEWKSGRDASQLAIRLRLAPLKGGLMLSLPVALVSTLVDLQFGGDGTSLRASELLSASEQHYFEHFAEGVARCMRSAWREVSVIDPDVVSLYTGGAAPALVSGKQKVIVHGLSLALHGRKPFDLSLVTPVSLASSVPQLSEPPESEEPVTIDPIWQSKFHKAVMQAQLPIRTIFARPELPVRQLLSLACGDVIPICLPDQLPVTVAGRRFALGTIGESNGRAAIRIEHVERESGIHE